jgi:hypothetical protein
MVSPGVSSACDDIPHSIPYHGGVCLSSATRSFDSYQPVAFRFASGRRTIKLIFIFVSIAVFVSAFRAFSGE